MLNNVLYSKSLLFGLLKNNGFSNDKVEEIYRIYSGERDNTRVKESNILNKVDITNLLSVASKLLHEVKQSLK